LEGEGKKKSQREAKPLLRNKSPSLAKGGGQRGRVVKIERVRISKHSKIDGVEVN
jgi:hypothetical protein